MAAPAYTAGCFGKLPLAADFLQHQTGGAAARAFLHWCEEGVHLLAERRGAETGDLLSRMPALGFVFPDTRSNEFLVGRMIPGRDASGRRFPFSAFLRGSGWKSLSFGASPLAFENFFAHADRLLSSNPADVAAFLEGIDALHATAPPAGALDPHAFERSLAGREVGPEKTIEAAERQLARLAARGRQFPGYALRFPLPAGTPPEAWASFWLGLAERAFGRLPAAAIWGARSDGAPSGARESGSGPSLPAYLDLIPEPYDRIAFLHLADPGFESERLMTLAEDSNAPPSRTLESTTDLADFWREAVARLEGAR
ncbi:MAG: type VI secretion system-associated protein TagF [Candidatus Eisenbacteria bacterium]